MSRSNRILNLIRYIVPLVVTVGLCYVLYADVDWADVLVHLRSSSPLLVASFLGLTVLAQIFRAYRWRLQLRPLGINPSTGVMVRSIFGTYAVNIVFPRLGELWRCGYVARTQRANFPAVFGSMVADRLADTLTMGLIALCAICVAHGPMMEFFAKTDLVHRIGTFVVSPWGIGLMAIAAIGVAALFMFRRFGFVEKIRQAVVNALHGFASIAHMPRVGQWLLLTVGIWGGYFLSMWVSMLAIPATAAVVSQLGVTCVLVTFVFGSMAMAVPSNGGIGPWQWAVVFALSGVYGMDHSAALAFATLNLAAETLLQIFLGLGTFISITIQTKRSNSL